MKQRITGQLLGLLIAGAILAAWVGCAAQAWAHSDVPDLPDKAAVVPMVPMEPWVVLGTEIDQDGQEWVYLVRATPWFATPVWCGRVNPVVRIRMLEAGAEG